MSKKTKRAMAIRYGIGYCLFALIFITLIVLEVNQTIHFSPLKTCGIFAGSLALTAIVLVGIRLIAKPE